MLFVSNYDDIDNIIIFYDSYHVVDSQSGLLFSQVIETMRPLFMSLH